MGRRGRKKSINMKKKSKYSQYLNTQRQSILPFPTPATENGGIGNLGRSITENEETENDCEIIFCNVRPAENTAEVPQKRRRGRIAYVKLNVKNTNKATGAKCQSSAETPSEVPVRRIRRKIKPREESPEPIIKKRAKRARIFRRQVILQESEPVRGDAVPSTSQRPAPERKSRRRKRRHPFGIAKPKRMPKRSFDAKMDSVNQANIDVFYPPYIDDHPKEEVVEENEVIVVEDDDDEREDVQIDEELPPNWIPKSDNLALTHGKTAVLALACDPFGYRLATGSSNGHFRLWDFATLDTPDSYFCTMMPCDNNPIKGVQYSKKGDRILVVSSGVQAVILDRDGFEVAQTAKGFAYQYDIADTKGHVGSLNCGAWNPHVKSKFMTSSIDGTCRIWRIDMLECHDTIIETRSLDGLKTIPTSCCYSKDGWAVTIACLDGSLQIWDTRMASMRPSLISENAHRRNEDISCVTYSHGGNLLGTRSRDTTLKLFDIRWFDMPVHSRAGLHCGYSETNCIFSPCDSMIATATSSNGEFGHGNVKFFDVNTFQMVNEIVMQDTQVIQILWQPKINQIMLGCENGSVQLYYDKKRSLSGAKYFAAKMKKKTKQFDVIAGQERIRPHLKPILSQDMPGSVGKQMDEDQVISTDSHRPDLPITAGHGGDALPSVGTFNSYFTWSLGLCERVKDELDPAEAILNIPADSALNPYWVSPIHAMVNTSPTISDPQDEEDIMFAGFEE